MDNFSTKMNFNLFQHYLLDNSTFLMETMDSSAISEQSDTLFHRPSITMRLFSLLQKVVRIFFPSVIFAKFFASSIIPPLADNLIPLFFTGNIPNESGLAIASQFTFISIILEVMQEGVGNSLFHFVGIHYESNRPLSLIAFKLSLVVLLAGGVVMTLLMLLFTPQFVNFIDTPDTIAEETRIFLYTSSFSFIPTILNTAFANYLLISTSSWLVLSQLATVVLSFLNNFFLFGQHDWSLHWGIGELGYYKVIQSTLTMCVNFAFVLVVEKLSPIAFLVRVPFCRGLKTHCKAFFRISWGNFSDSAVRNFFYFVVTLKFMNNLGENETGAWNLLNSIIWGIILIPGYVVANYAKVCIGHNNSRVRIKTVAHECCVCLFAWILVVSVISGIFWSTFAGFFSKSNKEVQELSETMFHHVGWIFIIFVTNNAIDSFFYGTGKTEYVFYQSAITNMVVYFPPWILYLLNIIKPTYWWVIGLYIAGMLVDFVLTSFFCLRVWRSMRE